MDLKYGSVVRLKSGGPVMTIGGFPGGHTNNVLCLWHDSDGKMQSAMVRSETLILVESEGKS